MNAYDRFILEKNAFLLLGRKSYVCVCVRSLCSQCIKQILTYLKREINNYTE